ncbi:hypothetical protein MIR68_009606 [Amoeboaphelidium protococcarum]|nr:hypothetical protein MIR68_009606 [Amoeboaphelidium protococcarum]
MDRERQLLVEQILQLSQQLKVINGQVIQAREDYYKLNAENQVLETYMDNLQKRQQFSNSQQLAANASKSPKNIRKTLNSLFNR